jgi:hypothetical protein
MLNNERQITVWGTGSVREFLFVEDAAEDRPAAERYDGINRSTRSKADINQELTDHCPVNRVKGIVDASKPTGMRRSRTRSRRRNIRLYRADHFKRG